MQRRKPGEIRDSVVSALRKAERPLTVRQIHAEVCRDLGSEVARSSVQSSVTLHEGSFFLRASRGQYVLPEYQGVEPEPPEHPVFEYGQSRLYSGDCRRWLAGWPENSIEAVVTDPPYGLVEYAPVQQKKLREGSGGVWRIPPSFDGHQRSPLPRFTTLTSEDLRSLDVFFTDFARKLIPVLVPGGHLFIASNPLLSYIVSGAFARAGFERRGEIVRLVMTMRGGDRPKNAHDEFPDVTVMPRSKWEPWLLFRKPVEGRVQDNLRNWKTGGLRRVSAEKPFADVIQSHPASPTERALASHPSLKPQEFLRQIVRASLPLGEGTVLDPFAGSGSTLAAAEAVGYRSIGVELDEHYLDLSRRAIPRLAALQCQPVGFR